MKLEKILEEGNLRFEWDLSLDSSGRSYLNLTDGVQLIIEQGPESETFTLFSIIAKICANQKVTLFPKFLESNLFRKHTGKSNLGYDKESQSLILFQTFNEPLCTALTLYDDISLFIAYLIFWKKEIKNDEKELYDSEIHVIDEHISALIGKRKKEVFFA
jgi:hypothetical protein